VNATAASCKIKLIANQMNKNKPCPFLEMKKETAMFKIRV
jgi:hypothetical protein